ALVNAKAANSANAKRSETCFMSKLLLEISQYRISGPLGRDRHQLPPLQAESSELVFRRILIDRPPHVGLQFDDLVAPLPAHRSSPGDFVLPGSRPALRSASRSTYSICAFRLRSSSSDQRCTAARISAL